MNWETVCARLSAIECGGPSVEVNGVEYDSRRVGRGDVFVAMRGEATDGNRYIEAAVAQGAAAVVTDSREAYAGLRREHAGVAAAWVERGRRALAALSANARWL
jgi:UDP-N-acetylmuramoyl-L-alanyl-D-glutamate--2,6-diaminopimelate ligase